MTKKTKLKIILVIIGLTAVFFYGKNHALAFDDLSSLAEPNLDYIMTKAPGTEAAVDKGALANIKKWIEKISWDTVLEEARKQTGIAFKAMLGNFLNNMAYDTANYLATGDWGQHPMFETKDFGSVLKYAADNAAGTFIEQLGQNSLSKFNIKFNLCAPDFRVLLKINLGLRAAVRPKAPPCTFSKLTQNWDQALKSKDFLPQFQDMFNPWSNDLGIALTLQTGMETEINRQANLKLAELQKNQGFNDVKDQISGFIKTPASLVARQAGLVLEEGATKEKTYVGVAADAIDIFINTLAGKLLDKWMKKGLVTNFPPLTTALDSLTNPYAQNQGQGAAGAADRLAGLLEPNFRVRGDYNVLNELATCPDPNKAGPTNCVIDEKFRQAIEKRLTVAQALEQGYLNGNGIFGFTADGLEPRYNEGYPYRSMLILRKFRIIPVGWEVAAQKIKDQQAQVGGTKNLKDLVNCSQSWCRGLLDPDWVLKAPQNFCKREGAGPIITSEQVTGQGADSGRSILRDDNYCADEQSCIKEKPDGSCQLYGYCSEERRKWDFNSKSCEPRDNTCQTFKSEDGQTVSYLQNTLDYGNCSAGNAGCLRYAAADSYNSADKSVDWSATQAVYLNKNAAVCEAADEGCRQLIRLNPGGGANLLVNSGFEEDLAQGSWSGFGARTDAASYQGEFSLQMNGAKSRDIKVAPVSYDIAGESYTLSFYAKNCGLADSFSIEDKSEKLEAGADWQRYNLSYTYSAGQNAGNEVRFSINSSSCLIDNIKLEKAGQTTAYSGYGAPNQSLIYEKLLPGYLTGVCYDDQGRLMTGAPADCSKFARQCKREEAGCELYTSLANGMKIPAQVKAKDYCPAVCVGYNTFVQSETYFENKQDAYFIPKTAKTCSAQAAGCDQFTNLDEVAKGGEGIEYYSALRQCQKPDGSCAEFYTWQGSDESGFQLKVESLTASSSGAPAAAPGYDLSLCDADIYNAPAGDPRHNDDCRQFYNRAGNVFYVLRSTTKICTDDCHPYRRTATDDSEANCQAHGGEWNTQYGACVYLAVPGQGQTCSAAASGCREYNGNTGNNVRNIFTDDFRDSTTGAWSGYVSPGSDSPTLGPDNKGHSLRLTAPPPGKESFAWRRSGGVKQGKAYVLKFLAKAQAPTELVINLGNGASTSTFAVTSLTASWQIFTSNLDRLSHEVTANENLELYANENLNITNITLTEITDRYYLIKNSWRTPAVCDQDLDGNVNPLYMLGCDQYQDRAAFTHNLKQFNNLCSESAVGCELMIDTRNSSNPAAETFNQNDSASKLTVPADDFIYAVYDQSKLCGQEGQGCERLGKPYVYDQTTIYGDVYLKNNPEKYDQILCDSGAVGCKAWAYNNGQNDNGEKYFKDPGDQVCEWRLKAGAGTTQGWFKKKVKRCSDAGAAVCLSDTDCAANVKCQLETVDQLCPLDTDAGGLAKTLGWGGSSPVSQPAGNGWAGTCDAAASGCGEYLDPVSRFNTNLIFNGSFQTLANGPTDGWNNLKQNVMLEPNTVYRLGRSADAGSLALSACPNALYEINENNNLSGPNSAVEVLANDYASSKIIYYHGSAKASCEVAVSGPVGAVELKKATVDYQLKQNLDAASCNGEVDFNKGCVLFNQRSAQGNSFKALEADADTGLLGEAARTEEKDANTILKVAPDRTCDQWLACKSFVKDEKGNNVCYDAGLCDAVDDNGNCSSFLTPAKNNQQADALGADKISNLSGYSEVGFSGGSLRTDYYPLGAMEQTGELANLANGGFETAGANGYPIGWSWSSQSGADKSWSANIFSVINNPIAAQSEGIDDAPEGRNFLKLGSSFSAESEQVDVIPGTDYIITAYANTKNLKTGQAIIAIATTTAWQVIKEDLGSGWQFKMGKFKTGAGVSSVKVKLYAILPDGSALDSAQGNFYFDDIKIRPALNSRDDWYTNQSCRLYPQTDSLSCDYYDDSGKRQKGWYGYCLQYDRPPGDPNACLLWYPIDKVKGDGIEEGAGYQGRTPLYYCLEAKGYCVTGQPERRYYCSKLAQVVTTTGQNKVWSSNVYQGSSYELPFASSQAGAYINWSDSRENVILNYARDGSPFGAMVPPSPASNPYDWDGQANTDQNANNQPLEVAHLESEKSGARAGTPYYGTSLDCGVFTKPTETCSGSATVYCPAGTVRISYRDTVNDGKTSVAPTGDNGCTASEPSNHGGGCGCEVTCQNITSNNAYHIASTLEEARAGVERLFAQSYGVWEWKPTDATKPAANGRYLPVSGLNWQVPEITCDSSKRQTSSNSYCAILPQVSNVRVSGSAGNYEINNTGFINLTFNSNIDGQQLPMTMYGVDWGDGTKTVVSGVSMRDRPNPSLPHSLYHLYSYWDLKAKANQGIGNINCSGNQCAVKPKIQIKDNWGWCNGGNAINDCSRRQSFDGEVVVKEK